MIFIVGIVFLITVFFMFAEAYYERDIPRRTIIFAIVMAIALLCSVGAQAQNSRYDYFAATTTGSGNLLPLLVIPGAAVNFYTGCTSLPCSTYANVYNSASGATACPTTAQIVLNDASVCVAVADGEGNFGGWFLPGQYQYTITAFSATYGPYSFTIGLNTASSAGAATNLLGGALGSAPYQSAANTTAFIPSPTTAGTYLYAWQPTGSAVAPTAISLASLGLSPVSIANGGTGQTTGIAALNALGAGSGTTPFVLGYPITAPSVNGRPEVSLYPGSELGAQIGAAMAAYPSGALLKLKAGTYTQTTGVTINPLLYGMEGDGPSATIINCSYAGMCYHLTEGSSFGAFTVAQPFGEFSLFGTSTANSSGITIDGVIGAQFTHIYIYTFTGTSSYGLAINNTASGNGWSEQNHFFGVRLEQNTVGWMFQCNTSNINSCSFGYTYADVHFGIASGQIGVEIKSGRLYNSNLAWRFNASGGQTALIRLDTNSGFGADLDSNTYDLTGEGGGPGIIAQTGTKFTGNGNVFGGANFVDTFTESASTFGGTFTTALGALSGGLGQIQSGDYGTITNFHGTGNTVTPTVSVDNYYATLGTLHYTNTISGPFVSMLYGTGNAFSVFACGAGLISLGGCNEVSYIDYLGNQHITGAQYASNTYPTSSVSFTGLASGITSATCTSGRTCNSGSGYVTVVSSTFTTGLMFTVTPSTPYPATPQCVSEQAGGSAWLGVFAQSVATTGFIPTVTNTITGQTISIYYSCKSLN